MKQHFDRESTANVYARNCREAHCQALRNNFPVVKFCLGEKTFSELAQVYCSFNSAKHWDINTYGLGFAEFVGAQRMSQCQTQPWQLLEYLSLIEYRLACVYYGVDDSDSAVFDRYLEPEESTNLGLNHDAAFDDGWQTILANVFAEKHPYLQLSEPFSLFFSYKIVIKQHKIILVRLRALPID